MLDIRSAISIATSSLFLEIQEKCLQVPVSNQQVNYNLNLAH